MPELKLPFFGHGGDYNPDQWRDRPDVLEEDVRLMKLAGCNLMSVGIFAWSALEPEEGRFDFGWLEDVLDRFAENGIFAFLATPSGARPAWMSEKYPEVLRVREDGLRNLHGGRHNHCFTSPVYRGFVRRINAALAERFGRHPAVVGWHVSNEYGGECHCERCQEAFRAFLKEEYGSLDALNRAWWTGFWSKTYTDWSQLHSPSRFGEAALHGLNLSWKRFVTRQTVDFMRAEVAPLRAAAPDLPVTTNLMTLYEGLDPFRFASVVDFASFDSYPRWGADDEAEAAMAALNFDIMRCILRRPFALMESTPSQVNWQDVCKLKKPGMHLLSSLHAVAHGADTVQYFQWRKSRGASEKFHGAVVDHVGHEHTRTFRDVAEVGRVLPKLAGALGAPTPARVALIFDWENRWALGDSQGRGARSTMRTRFSSTTARCGAAAWTWTSSTKAPISPATRSSPRRCCTWSSPASPKGWRRSCRAAARSSPPAAPAASTATTSAFSAASPARCAGCWVSGLRKPTRCTTARPTRSAWRTAAPSRARRCATSSTPKPRA